MQKQIRGKNESIAIIGSLNGLSHTFQQYVSKLVMQFHIKSSMPHNTIEGSNMNDRLPSASRDHLEKQVHQFHTRTLLCLSLCKDISVIKY